MSLKLAYSLDFADLYSRDGLLRVDAEFGDFLMSQDVGLFNRLMTARQKGYENKPEESDCITLLAPYVEEFIGQLFSIQAEITALKKSHNRLSPIYECKRQFVQRRAAKKFKPAEAEKFDGAALRKELERYLGQSFDSLTFAKKTLAWLEKESEFTDQLDIAERYAAWALYSVDGQHDHKKDVLFKIPKKIDPQNLVAVETELRDGYRVLKLPKSEYRARDGFHLTDAGGGLEFALDQANYCIWCHKQNKDSCSQGLREKSSSAFQKSAHGVDLAGCPLEEKISEMNMVKAQGNIIGSLAIAAIDNPLCAMTGHRICNDCMKSCIFQKQEPVDIPQIETQILRDVLGLPWGFEIYGLLTRWNPLNVMRPVPALPSGRKILVVGAGPAGINLSHHLLNDGHYVCLIDGLKIEPLNMPFAPIHNAQDLWEDLDQRITAGFGGVAEYGITVRWDKNFLKIVRLLLERRALFDLYGGVRFGGTITTDQAFAMGFDHVALCMGAGKPTILDIPGNMAKGVRAASDFLMALQLTGAGQRESLANLQIRLPAIVIGGGLTAIDTATELLAYYPVQVEKFLRRYETLGEKLASGWSSEDQEIANEFMMHAKALRTEKSKPNPDIIGLLQSWGGVTVCYRKDLQQSPSYTLNHEEVHKAMEEGIYFAPNLTPLEIKTDAFGWVSSTIFKSDINVVLPAKSVLIAAGTQPNTVLAREQSGIALDGKYFQAYDDHGRPVTPQKSAKPDNVYIFMHHQTDGRSMSYFGDLHPSFAGNVVKAMASAKRGYPLITQSLQKLPATKTDVESLRQKLRDDLNVTVHAVNRLTDTIIEVVLHAPAAARNFQPGQFFRLQNFATKDAMAMEGLAMTGAWVDVDRGLLATIILEMGGSSSLCHLLQPGDPVILMGPTGAPTEIPTNETVLLIGGGLGNAVLFSIGQAMRANNNRVIYFAGYKKPADRFKPQDIESASDVVVWCSDTGPEFIPSRPQDRAFIGNMVQALAAHNDLLRDVDRIICIGSDRLMTAVAAARHGVLKDHLPSAHIAIGSINSPMQCMLKEICAQCIQRHIDPQTGAEKIVFSCFNQDQELDHVDWQCLNDRLKQNATQEKLTAAWIEQEMKGVRS